MLNHALHNNLVEKVPSYRALLDAVNIILSAEESMRTFGDGAMPAREVVEQLRKQYDELTLLCVESAEKGMGWRDAFREVRKLVD